jgi:hypothetical protein
MDLRKILENYHHLCKKVVIFWKNITALKVCWLGVEKLVFLGYLGAGVSRPFRFSPHGVRDCQSGSHLQSTVLLAILIAVK